MIRSSRHHIKDLNCSKRRTYEDFLDEYSKYVITVVDEIWKNGYKEFNVKENKLFLTKYIDYKDFNLSATLSARAKSSAITQVSEIIRASVERQRRRIWVKENKNAKVKNIAFSKPELTFVQPRLSSKCCDFEFSKGKFLGFLNLRSLGKNFEKIKIPIIRHPRAKGDIKSGFLLSKNSIQLSWEIKTSSVGKGNKILAIDQGLNDVAACSDGQVTTKECPHGHSLSKILNKLSNKRKGSKAFKKAQSHRKNFINWSINQLNLSGLKEVRLEKVVNIRFKRNSSRKMSHWCNPEIRDKIKNRCEELEVPVIEQSCAYRSQRCNQCGQVRKANRKGKIYSCKNCKCETDADFNASLNHLGDLPSVPVAFLGKKLNLKNGFFWFEDGFFIDAGRRVPCS